MESSQLQVQPAMGNREAPWIGCGTKGAWTDYKEALADCELDFFAVGNSAYTHVYDASGYAEKHVPGIAVNIRPDTNDILGVVSENYRIVQNEDAFQMLEPFTRAGGVITNCGMTEQGLVFMVLRLQSKEILGDLYDVDVMCTNSFNGAFPCALIMAPTRIVCQNMYRKLMGNKDNVMRFLHSSRVDERIQLAKQATGNVMRYMEAFRLQLEKAASNKMNRSRVDLFVSSLFPYPDPGGAREAMSFKRVDEMRIEFYERYYMAADNANFIGTGMGFINAYMDYLSHREPTKKMGGSWADRRLSGLVSGSDVKWKVIQAAL